MTSDAPPRWERPLAVLLRPLLCTLVQRYLRHQPRPAHDDRATAIGPHPVRVLIVGAGLAIGYGLDASTPALPEQLARALAAELRRGVIVESRLQASMRLERTITRIGLAGATSFDAVVWCPTLEDAFRGGGRRWVRHLRLLVDRIEETGTRRVRIVLLGVVEDEGAHLLQRLSAALIGDVNSRIETVASEYDRVDFLPVPAKGIRSWDEPLFDAGYQRDVVQRLTRLLGELQRRPAAQVAPGIVRVRRRAVD